MNKRLNMLRIFVLGISIAIAGTGRAAAHQDQPSNQFRADQSTDIRDVRVPDTKKQIARLSKKLKLKGTQKKGVVAILSDRDRDIELIQESEVLSQDAKASRIATIVSEYNAHIEDVLNNKQKQKFEQVLIRQREREERNRQAARVENLATSRS